MKQEKVITIVIADDHPILRKGIRELITEDGRFTLVQEVGQGDKVIEAVQKHTPDILLLDLNLPRKNGLDIAAELQSTMPETSIIIMTMHKEKEIFDKALSLGIKGYLLKEGAEDDLLECISIVLGGDFYISPQLSNYLLERKTKYDELLQAHPSLNTLSPTERRILKLVSENKTSKDIAEVLHISVKTVHNHRFNICKRLNLHGINGLLKFAIENKTRL